MRGILSKEVQEISKKIIGREIIQGELRLMPYLQFVLMNEQHFDMRKLNLPEHDILSLWEEEGFYFPSPTKIAVSKKFWDFMSEVLWKSYVLQEGEKEMYNLNANLSALVHIQKIKSKEEAEAFLKKINQEIAKWIKEIREIHESLEELK